MDIAIGLPSTIPGATGREVIDWAARADEVGFSSVATIDHVAYPNHESVPVLAAAAAVTERVRLISAIIIAPYRGNGVLLAKQLATIDSLSNGRLTAGLAVGGRRSDYDVTGTSFTTRGRDFDEQLRVMRAVWSGESLEEGPVGPAPVQPGGPPMLFGGRSEAEIRRSLDYGIGWIAGAAGAAAFAQSAEQVRAAWSAAGRGKPRLAALAYFSLGARAEDNAAKYLTSYYAFLASPSPIIDRAFREESAIVDGIKEFEAAGCDELILFPCAPELDQLDALASIALRT
jgi:alkanesulfonate monooxygenase SsuD/methylene tetrahydromethanopterin reductase-like flavin-dependent oxidoreductase (luciferase family)